MRFNTDENTELGEIKQVTKFLLFPLTLQGETRWLEFATWFERYEPTSCSHFKEYRWQKEAFIDQKLKRPVLSKNEYLLDLYRREYHFWDSVMSNDKFWGILREERMTELKLKIETLTSCLNPYLK